MGENRSNIKAIFLIILIIASAVVIYKYGFKKNPGAAVKMSSFICTKCGNLIEIKTERTTELTKDNMAKCPSCGTYTAKKAIVCIFCKKAYLVEQSLEKYKEKYRCVHCGRSLSDQGNEKTEGAK